MWPVRLRAAGLRKRTKAALPGRKRGNAVVIWSLNLLGIFLHSILRHAVVGFRHAFLRLVLLLHCLGICVYRVVGFVASCPAGLVVWAEATDTFAQNPSAKKLGLEVAGVTMLSVDESKVGSPVCLVSVNTNHGHSLRYRFRFSAEGTASADMVP